MIVPYMNISLGLISCDSCTKKFGDDFQIAQGLGYNLIHFYCLVVDAGFYSDMVECLPVAGQQPGFDSCLGQIGIFCTMTMAPNINNPPYDLV